MKKRILNFLFTATMLFAAVNVFGQGSATLTGTVTDGNESLIGANVVAIHSESGQQYGTITDLDGNFEITGMKTGAYKVTVSFIGYSSIEKDVTIADGANSLDVVKLDASDIGIAEVSVLASVAVDRKTPVALSSIEPEIISEKLGTKEFPEILKSTPSVYATKGGGAFGDSRINLRGFKSENIAVMINGVPVNDMEWGGIYWSNWAGLSDVTRSMQVQRGLGASKIAVPSVGGSINIITNTTDAKRGGTVSTKIGNDGYSKISFSTSTGLTKNNWAVTLSGAKTQGNGYILGTEFEGFSYFINISKKINDKHLLSLTGFGAPQWHNQRSSFDKQKIGDWEKHKEGYRWNATYGFGANGQRKTSAKNYYHKPQFSLNHYWTINNTTNLSTAMYYSFGTGGGHSARGGERSRLYGSSTDRTIEGYLNYDTIMQDNASNPQGSQSIIGSSNNNHQWYGVISNLKKDFSENLTFSGGLDFRYYIGEHNRTVKDLLGGAFFIDPARKNVTPHADNIAYINEPLGVGDKISRDYYGHVLWSGAFGQVEYTMDALTVFASGAISNTRYWRVDKMYYLEANEKSDNVDFLGWSGKGGATYNLNENHFVFANGGYFSRAPYFSNVYLGKDVSNVINKNAVNEKVASMELGYGLRYQMISLNLNLYNTLWLDKAEAGTIDESTPDRGWYNAEGVSATHRGIELDFVATPLSFLTVRGMLSIGDWKWDKNVTALTFDSNGQAVDEDGEIVTPGSEDHHKIEILTEGVHVTDAAQTTASLGLDIEVIKEFKIGIDYNFFDNYYSRASSVTSFKGEDTWKTPAYGYIDANIRYNFEFAGLKSTLYANVDNVFDTEYISDADGTSQNWQDARVFYGFGRTWSLGLKLRF